MARRAAHLSDNGANRIGVQPHRHGCGQLVGTQHAALGQYAHVHSGYPQQDRQHPRADVPHIGGALAHHVILHAGEHIGIHTAHLVYRRLGAAARVDGVLHLTAQKRVRQHSDLARQDFSLMVAHLGADALCQCLSGLVELLHGALKALLFRLLARVAHAAVIQTLFTNTDGISDADAVRGGNSAQLHSLIPPNQICSVFTRRGRT